MQWSAPGRQRLSEGGQQQLPPAEWCRAMCCCLPLDITDSVWCLHASIRCCCVQQGRYKAAWATGLQLGTSGFWHIDRECAAPHRCSHDCSACRRYCGAGESCPPPEDYAMATRSHRGGDGRSSKGNSPPPIVDADLKSTQVRAAPDPTPATKFACRSAPLGRPPGVPKKLREPWSHTLRPQEHCSAA